VIFKFALVAFSGKGLALDMFLFVFSVNEDVRIEHCFFEAASFPALTTPAYDVACSASPVQIDIYSLHIYRFVSCSLHFALIYRALTGCKEDWSDVAFGLRMFYFTIFFRQSFNLLHIILRSYLSHA